ncbi:molybdopterin molybdotransferase MoeA [Microaerobacter geothermalis]|uniref:molybdopterin molybdotransferase MoeA n=1 Tax=Microaerobacter geothermalis TaxID=674972 RepID=UPI002E31CC33|nr:gephyrin-like molybdotransferase Glp [Microaerobacter geothermalis]
MIKVEEAVEKVMQFIHPMKVEQVPIEEAYGRYLAEPLIADHDIPFRDRSPLDGFAIRSEDTIGATHENPITLRVIEEVGAGQLASKRVGKKEAIRIMTGADMPEGANAVVMLEMVKELPDKGLIQIPVSFTPGQNVSKRGEDIHEGKSLVPSGTRIGPGEITLLATFGYAKVPVYKKPVVGILATGTELLSVEQSLKPGKIRNSNSYMVASLLIKYGAEPRIFQPVQDDVEKSVKAVEHALTEVDYLITTGGVSVGDYDVMIDVFSRVGAEIVFDKIAMRPGSPTTFAVRDKKLIFGLSGNPAACFVGFELYVRPAILSMMSVEHPYMLKLEAFLDGDFKKPSAYPRFVRAKAYVKEGQFRVKPVGLDKAGVTSTLKDANCLVYIPAGGRGINENDRVSVLMLEMPEGYSYDSSV